MSSPARNLALVLVGGSLFAAFGCVNNPVHDDQVEALGPEDPAVPPGPNHRPGQPCLVCHGPFGPASVEFAVAGTVYEAAGQPQPAVGAVIRIEDVTGSTVTPSTNEAGNFYVLLRDFAPTYPLETAVSSAGGGIVQTMQGYVARNGSCASCHTKEAGPSSAGPVVISVGIADAATKG